MWRDRNFIMFLIGVGVDVFKTVWAERKAMKEKKEEPLIEDVTIEEKEQEQK